MSIKITDKRQLDRMVPASTVPSGQYFLASFGSYNQELFLCAGSTIIRALNPSDIFMATEDRYLHDYVPVNVEIVITSEE